MSQMCVHTLAVWPREQCGLRCGPMTADAWPWAFDAIQRIMLDPTGLIHEIGVESHADVPMPMGLGIHPYFAVSIGDRFQFNADAIWEADADGCGRRLRAPANNERLHDL